MWMTRAKMKILVTDTHQYLHFGSCHQHHTKTSIPYNLVRRICTTVSEKDTRNIRLNELKTYLLKQKYPEQLIDNFVLQIKFSIAKEAVLSLISILSSMADYLSRLAMYHRNIKMRSSKGICCGPPVERLHKMPVTFC